VRAAGQLGAVDLHGAVLEWIGRPVPIKPLQLMAAALNRPLHRLLVVDDTPSTYCRNLSNALPVTSSYIRILL